MQAELEHPHEGACVVVHEMAHRIDVLDGVLDGTPPLPTHPPIHMSLVTDICVKGADGKWRYKSRKFDTLFEGGAKPTNPVLEKK